MSDEYGAQVRAQLRNAQQKLADLQQRYDDEHATAVERARETERVRRQLAAAEDRIAAVREFADRDQDGICCSHMQGDLRRLLDGPAEPPADDREPPSVEPGRNAEDCPACDGVNLAYPFICPGHATDGPS